jgi:hypothetical protein
MSDAIRKVFALGACAALAGTGQAESMANTKNNFREVQPIGAPTRRDTCSQVISGYSFQTDCLVTWYAIPTGTFLDQPITKARTCVKACYVDRDGLRRKPFQ